jgi:hypothetical protein
MIRVRRLRMQLPRHLRHQAEAIARLAAQRLAQDAPPSTERRVGHLAVGPLAAPRGVSRQRLAGDVASAIGRGLAAKRGQGRGGGG